MQDMQLACLQGMCMVLNLWQRLQNTMVVIQVAKQRTASTAIEQKFTAAASNKIGHAALNKFQEAPAGKSVGM